MIKFERAPLSKQGLGIGRYKPEVIQEIFDEYFLELNTLELRKEIAAKVKKKTGLKAQDITSPEDMDSTNIRFRIWDSSNNELGIIKSEWT